MLPTISLGTYHIFEVTYLISSILIVYILYSNSHKSDSYKYVKVYESDKNYNSWLSMYPLQGKERRDFVIFLCIYQRHSQEFLWLLQTCKHLCVPKCLAFKFDTQGRRQWYEIDVFIHTYNCLFWKEKPPKNLIAVNSVFKVDEYTITIVHPVCNNTYITHLIRL